MAEGTLTFEAADEGDTERLGRAPGRAAGRGGRRWAHAARLGAGKTRLVQAIAAALDIDRRDVVSPTFVLVHEYHGRTADLSSRRLSPARQRRIPAARRRRVLRAGKPGARRMGRPVSRMPAAGASRRDDHRRPRHGAAVRNCRPRAALRRAGRCAGEPPGVDLTSDSARRWRWARNSASLQDELAQVLVLRQLFQPLVRRTLH